MAFSFRHRAQQANPDLPSSSALYEDAALPGDSTGSLVQQFHEANHRRSNELVMSGVHGNERRQWEGLHGTAGYYRLPAPVLSESRKFANPSYGNFAGNYSDNRSGRHTSWTGSGDGGGMHGGGTTYVDGAWEWMQSKLRDRIPQYAKIANARFLKDIPLPSSSTAFIRKGGEDKEMDVENAQFIELSNVLQRINSDVDAGTIGAATLKRVFEFMALLFQLAPKADDDDLTEIADGIHSAATTLQAALLADRPSFAAVAALPVTPQTTNRRATLLNRIKYTEDLLDVLSKLYKYMTEMLTTTKAPTKERFAVSRHTIRTLGFKRMIHGSKHDSPEVKKLKKEAELMLEYYTHPGSTPLGEADLEVAQEAMEVAKAERIAAQERKLAALLADPRAFAADIRTAREDLERLREGQFVVPDPDVEREEERLRRRAEILAGMTPEERRLALEAEERRLAAAAAAAAAAPGGAAAGRPAGAGHPRGGARFMVNPLERMAARGGRYTWND